MNLDEKAISLEVNISRYFLSLFIPQRKRIYGFINAIVQNRTAADDIFQDVSRILWQEFNSFVPGTSFTKWSNAIVFNCIRSFRQKNKKYAIGLNEEVFEQLIQTFDENDQIDRQWALLQSCLSRLTASTFRVYHGFYIENLSADAIAQQTGRSIYGVRNSLRRLRKSLFDCVDSKKSEIDA